MIPFLLLFVMLISKGSMCVCVVVYKSYVVAILAIFISWFEFVFLGCSTEYVRKENAARPNRVLKL